MKEEELSHTPNEGDPIRADIVKGHEDFMSNYRTSVVSSFGANVGLLHTLLNGNTEKNIAGLAFQRSDLQRMLSHKMLRDNSLEMYSKVMAQRCALKDVPKKVYFIPLFWYVALSNPSCRALFLDKLPNLDS